MSDAETVLDRVDELVKSFLGKDRKKDEDLPRGAIERLIKDEEVSLDDIVDRFRESLEARLEDVGRRGSDEDEEEDDDGGFGSGDDED